MARFGEDTDFYEDEPVPPRRSNRGTRIADVDEYESEEESKTRKRQRIRIILGLFIVAIAIVAIGLGVGLGRRNNRRDRSISSDDEPRPTFAPVTLPTASPVSPPSPDSPPQPSLPTRVPLPSPDEPTTNQPTGFSSDSVLDATSRIPDLSIFNDLVTILGENSRLRESLEGEGPIVLFAPTDSALSNINLNALTERETIDLLEYHVLVDGRMFSRSRRRLDTAVPSGAYTTLNGYAVVVNEGGLGEALRVNGVPVGSEAIQTRNGVIFKLNQALQPPEDSIVDIAVAGGFTILVELLEATGLAGQFAFNNGGPFTVFAPTNEAFEAALQVLDITLDELKADVGTTTTILSYHVVVGSFAASDLAALDSVPTVEGSEIEIQSSLAAILDEDLNATIAQERIVLNRNLDEHESLRLNGNTQIVTPDIIATNGIIHVIDSVLLPPNFRQDASPSPSAVETTLPPFASDVNGTMAPSLPASLAPSTGDATKTKAPTEHPYFGKGKGKGVPDFPYSKGKGKDSKSSKSKGKGSKSKSSKGKGSSSSYYDYSHCRRLKSSKKSKSSKSSKSSSSSGKGYHYYPYEDDCHRTSPIRHTSSGALERRSIPDLVGDFFDLSIIDELLSLQSQSDVREILDGNGPFTLFAPLDYAFDGIDLAAIADDEITSILSYHVLNGGFVSGHRQLLSVLTAGEYTSLTGEVVSVEFTESGVEVNGARVVRANILARNGVIHLIDNVLSPLQFNHTVPTQVPTATVGDGTDDILASPAPSNDPTNSTAV